MRNLFKKQPRLDYRSQYFMSGGNVPPDRNTEGFLRAYGEIGWLYAVVFRIALGCSEVKWALFDNSNREKPKQISQHPILRLLSLVNPFMTSNEFIALDTIYQELIGESFWILNFNGLGEPTEIWIPYPHKMSIVPDKEKFIKGYVYGEGERAVPFDVNEVIHFKYPSPLNQYRGLGPAQSIAVDLDAEMYSGQWNRNFFYNSARPDGVIQFDYNLSDEQFEKLRKQWSEKYKGTSKAHQVALLEGGGKYIQVQNTVKDMDFSNLKIRNRDVILGVYGMPQSVMGISENVNKANAEAGDYTFARWIVKPRLDWKTAKLQEQLIPKFKKSENLKLGFEEVVPETIDQKRDLAESGMRAGYLTINEARRMQGYDPLPSGDVLLVPLNLIPTPISGKVQPPEPKSKSLTPDQKQTRWEVYSQKTARQEEMFKRVFENVFSEQGKFVAAEYERTGELPANLQDEETAKRFEPAIGLVYDSAFEDAVKSVKQLDEFARMWILQRSLTLAKSINTTTLTALQRELSMGFTAGESIPQISRRLRGYFTENAKTRADMIARTEVISASNEGALHRYEIEGIDKSEFYPAPDACEECAPLAGEYPTKESHGMIPVHARCRCVWLPVV